MTKGGWRNGGRKKIPDSEKKKTITIRLAPDLYEYVKKTAKKNRISLTKVVENSLKINRVENEK